MTNKTSRFNFDCLFIETDSYSSCSPISAYCVLILVISLLIIFAGLIFDDNDPHNLILIIGIFISACAACSLACSHKINRNIVKNDEETLLLQNQTEIPTLN